MEQQLCVCGCGNPVTPHEGKGRPGKYFHVNCRKRAQRMREANSNVTKIEGNVTKMPLSLPAQKLRSPVSWIGGKARIAKQIIAAFPHDSAYDVFCDVFCGSCSVLFAKQPSRHLEVINDRNGRLVNFWLAVREQAEYLQWKLQSLPYSEYLFKHYKESLESDETLDRLEEAARWFYINRGTIAGHIDSDKGWSYTAPQSKIRYSVPSDAVGYQNAVELFPLIAARLSRVQIHDWDFEKAILKYQSPRTLFYIDEPYRGTEHYYQVDGTPAFIREDHKRLARLLNETKALVAVSHYDIPELEEDYPSKNWRRVYWNTHKESSRMNKTLQVEREVLLMNYPENVQTSLWNLEAM